jgi:hypothetical protein
VHWAAHVHGSEVLWPAVHAIELLDPTSVDLENRRPLSLLLLRHTSTCPLRYLCTINLCRAATSNQQCQQSHTNHVFFSDSKLRPAAAHARTQPGRSAGGARSAPCRSLPVRWGRPDSCPSPRTARRRRHRHQATSQLVSTLVAN